MKFFCADCYTVFGRGRACACAGGGVRPAARALFGAPGEAPHVIGHLTLLDDTPRPWPLIEEICDGPRLFPEQLSAESRCCSWRHSARTVWVWQGDVGNLPPAGMRPARDDPSSLSLLRAMSETGLLLVEAPQPTPLFRAHYARNKLGGRELPELSLILDRLVWAFSLSAARGRGIALHDPGGHAGTEETARLKGMSRAFGLFKQRAEALRWLSAQVSSAAAPPAAAPRPRRADAGDKNGEEKQRTTPLVLSVFDVGGSVGRHLLARLHAATWAVASEGTDRVRPERSALVKLPGRILAPTRLHALSSAAGLNYGHVQHSRRSEPAPGSAVPRWEGHVTRWWWKKQPFVLWLENDVAAEKSDALILGVGPSRLFGERELARLLERVWCGHVAPAAIVRHAQADEDVLRWARHEFPLTPVFPDTAEGGTRALEVALGAARQRAST